MRIQNDGASQAQFGNTLQTTATRRSELASSGLGGASSRQVGLDRVDVSDTAETTSDAMDAARDASEARIEELTRLYRAGQISVNAESLASSIVDTDIQAADYKLDQ